MMRRIRLAIVGILMPWVLCLAQNDYEPGVILLKVKHPDVVSLSGKNVINGSRKLQSVLDRFSAMNSYQLPYAGPRRKGWYHVDFPKNASLKEIRKSIEACEDIEDVTLNHYGTYSEEPNDTHWDDQWALQKIQMEETWGLIKPNNEILVGILDSGLGRYHDDLSDNIWSNPDEIPGNSVDDDENGYVDDTWGWDFAANDNNPSEDPEDIYANYHGTRAAGVIAARTYNGEGIAGIAGGWQGQTGVRLVGCRVGQKVGQTSEITQEDAGDAIAYLTELHQRGFAVIANMSFQLKFNHDNDYGNFKDAVEDAEEEGVIMVAAAGNTKDKTDYQEEENDNLPAPARWDGVLAIGASVDGATLEDEEKANYSLYATGQGEKKVFAVAPVDGSSMSVYTTSISEDGEDYIYVNNFSGTSAACPMVVGVVALLLSVDNTLSYSQISNTLASTAEKIGGYTYTNGRTDKVGYGRINAYEAIISLYNSITFRNQFTGVSGYPGVIKVDDNTEDSPFSLYILDGESIEAEAINQTYIGINYTFDEWYDESTTNPRIFSPTSDVTYTAHYTGKPLSMHSYFNFHIEGDPGEYVTLVWNTHTNDSVQYQIWRKVKHNGEMGDPDSLTTLNHSVTTYVDTDYTITSGYTHDLCYYDVRAYYPPTQTCADPEWIDIFAQPAAKGSESLNTQPFKFEITAFPNPFNPETTIRYRLKERANVTLTIIDMLGRKVATLAEGERSEGFHSIGWFGKDAAGNSMPSGVYFYRFTAIPKSGVDIVRESG
ncbi:MAG: S8 family serine peptidase, partial [bacterium]